MSIPIPASGESDRVTIPTADTPLSSKHMADSGAEMAGVINEMARHGFFMRNARRVRLRNMQITGLAGAAFDLGKVGRLGIDVCGTSTLNAVHAILHTAGVAVEGWGYGI